MKESTYNLKEDSLVKLNLAKMTYAKFGNEVKTCIHNFDLFLFQTLHGSCWLFFSLLNMHTQREKRQQIISSFAAGISPPQIKYKEQLNK